MPLEPRTLPTDPAPAPVLDIAVQAPGNVRPTNKVAAATNAGGGIAAILTGAMTSFGGPMIIEQMGKYGETHPSTTQFVVAIVPALIVFFVTKYGGQFVAYNVLDKPNVALTPATPAP